MFADLILLGDVVMFELVLVVFLGAARDSEVRAHVLRCRDHVRLTVLVEPHSLVVGTERWRVTRIRAEVRRVECAV